MLNARDGGIGGVKIDNNECDFGYKTGEGVKCYERLKRQGLVVVSPMSTGLTNKLLLQAPVDKIPILTMGYGNSGTADGRYYAWAFNYPTTYWSQASVIIRYIGAMEKGIKNLAGKRIGFIYLESGYGKEPIPLLKILSKRFGYKLTTYSVPFKASSDQRSQWRKIIKSRQNWVIMWGWGVMNPTAIKRAAEVGFPMNRFIGVWWSGAEQDTRPNANTAIGYRAATFTATGANFGAHRDILKHVYKGDMAKAKTQNWGEVLYNRGLFNAVIVTEAVRAAIKKHGKKVTGTGVREGLENIRLTKARLAALGLAGFANPVIGKCSDHEGAGPVMIQRWNGKAWTKVSGWMKPDVALVRPMLTAKAKAEHKAKGGKFRPNCR